MYKLQQNSVLRLSDGASIPLADGNKDYEEYKQWLSEGNIPEPEFTDAELLSKAKSDKIALIDSTTAKDIEAIVGDNNKQKDLLASYNYLLEQKIDGVITLEETTLLAELKTAWRSVSDLKISGNTREAKVKALVLSKYKSLEKALVAINNI